MLDIQRRFSFLLLFIFLFFIRPVACAEHKADDVIQPDKSGRTPLHELATTGKARFVAMLTSVGSDDINAQTTSGYTPLHCVIANRESLEIQDCLEIVTCLLNAKANVNAQTTMGATPLWLATHYSLEPLLIKTLLDAKADPTIRVSWVTTKNKKKKERSSTPFHEIIKPANPRTEKVVEKVAGLFLHAKADPTAHDDQQESVLAKAVALPNVVKKMLKAPLMTKEVAEKALNTAPKKLEMRKEEQKEKIEASMKLLKKYINPQASPKSVKK